MRYTNDATELPTANALRLAARTRDTATEYVTRSIVLLVAVGTFVAGTTATALALSAAVAVLPANLLTLLATTATAFVALYAVPLLILSAVRTATFTSERPRFSGAESVVRRPAVHRSTADSMTLFTTRFALRELERRT